MTHQVKNIVPKKTYCKKAVKLDIMIRLWKKKKTNKK